MLLFYFYINTQNTFPAQRFTMQWSPKIYRIGDEHFCYHFRCWRDYITGVKEKTAVNLLELAVLGMLFIGSSYHGHINFILAATGSS